MAIAFDAATYGQKDASGTTLTITHTVASGGVLLVFGIYSGDSPTVTGVTYDSVALTSIQADVDDSGGVVAKNSLFAIHNPTTGSAKSVVISYSATGGGYMGGIAISYTGVVNSSVAAMHRAVAHGPTPSLAITSQSGDMVVAAVSSFGIITAGKTLRGAVTKLGTGGYYEAVEDTTASGASTTMDWSDSGFETIVGMALIPGAAGPTGWGPLLGFSRDRRMVG